MPKKISEITTQRLGTLIDNFHVCQSCGTVAWKISYPCSHCGQESEQQLYFSVPTVSLINLMQNSYLQKSTAIHRRQISNDDLRLAVLIFFCTLVEVLLENFLLQLMDALQIPDSDKCRKLKRNWTYGDRTEKVFPSLVNEQWNAAIKKLTADSNVDYEHTIKFYREVARDRNRILHNGIAAGEGQIIDDKIFFGVPENVPEKCMDEIMPLMNLFVELHNRYVRVHYAAMKRKYWSDT